MNGALDYRTNTPRGCGWVPDPIVYTTWLGDIDFYDPNEEYDEEYDDEEYDDNY